MTKKHFIQFAQLIANHKKKLPTGFITDLIVIFKKDNKRFDTVKFMEFIINNK